MQLLETTIRLKAGHRLILVPATLRFSGGGELPFELVDADIVIEGDRLGWTAWVGHALTAIDRAEIEANPTFTLALCDRFRTWPARRRLRADGIETVEIGENFAIDLSETSFSTLIGEEQRAAAAAFAEAIGKPAPSVI